MSTMMQVAIAFLVAGFGNVGAGLILNHVQEWPVFNRVSELFILVPALLGLKGNLEMTMASRLSTQANLGHMSSMRELLIMAKGNLALVQCQATVVSFLVAVFASVVKWQIRIAEAATILEANQLSMQTSVPTTPAIQPSSVFDQHDLESTNVDTSFNWDNAFVLCASSLLTANIACSVLGTLMVIVIVCSYKAKVDPDNIAAPVAASLGDMITAALLAVIAQSIYLQSLENDMPYLSLTIILLFFIMLPVWINVASTNPYTAHVVTSGWIPIGIGVIISALGGLILSASKTMFSRLSVFQPVVNGVGGNLVAVQASRLSTILHKTCKFGELPPNTRQFVGLKAIFFDTNDNASTTARLLLIMAVPAHLLYFRVICVVEGYSSSETTWLFTFLYLTLAMLQVAILLFMAQNLINMLWKREIDPDNYAIPLLTATGDFLGCAFLFFVFFFAGQFNDPFSIASDPMTETNEAS